MKLVENFNKGDDEESEKSAKLLSSYGDLAIPVLQELLLSDIEDERWWAVRTLSLLKNPPIDQIVKMLFDSSAEVKKCATLVIKHHPTKLAKDRLLELLSDSDPLLRKLAADALISIGSDVVPRILEVLPDLEGLGRVEAYRALAKIGDISAISVLYHGLNDESNLISFWSEEGLTKLELNMVYFKTI